MDECDTAKAEPPAADADMTVAEAQRRQAVYAASRREWAEAVGRPYKDEPDLRPPPGEVDAEADE